MKAQIVFLIAIAIVATAVVAVIYQIPQPLRGALGALFILALVASPFVLKLVPAYLAYKIQKKPTPAPVPVVRRAVQRRPKPVERKTPVKEL